MATIMLCDKPVQISVASNIKNLFSLIFLWVGWESRLKPWVECGSAPHVFLPPWIGGLEGADAYGNGGNLGELCNHKYF